MPTETTDTLTRVRQARHEISLEFGHDPHRLVAHYIALQNGDPALKTATRPERPARKRAVRPTKR